MIFLSHFSNPRFAKHLKCIYMFMKRCMIMKKKCQTNASQIAYNCLTSPVFYDLNRRQRRQGWSNIYQPFQGNRRHRRQGWSNNYQPFQGNRRHRRWGWLNNYQPFQGNRRHRRRGWLNNYQPFQGNRRHRRRGWLNYY